MSFGNPFHVFCFCQVNYWLDGDDEPVYKQYIRYQGQVSEGIVIGLFPDTNFWFEVQVFNTAGLGPLSEKFIQETLHEGILIYLVQVRSAHSVDKSDDLIFTFFVDCAVDLDLIVFFTLPFVFLYDSP